MIIRVDKCSTFGIKKASTSSVQYPPKLVLNHDLVPTVEIGKSFKYLGRHFNFTMDNHNHMSKVLDIFSGLMKKIDCILSLVIQKTNFFYTIILYSQKYHDILQLLILVRHGWLKT